MPLITTHYYFANDVLKNCNQKIKSQIQEKKEIYELFAQGFDVLLFYDFFKIKKENLLGYCHNNHTDTYFLEFIKNMKQEMQTSNPEFLAALYGHITHYVLDSNCHPYIVYKTGIYNPRNKDTQKYNGLHTKMEMQIDAFLYQKRKHKSFKKFKIHKYLITKEKLSTDLIRQLNKTYDKVFSIKNGGEKYQIGQKNMYYSYLFFIEDKYGIKYFIYKIIDFLLHNKEKFQYFSAHITNIDSSIFNTEHKTWYHPWLDNHKSTESFFDLYNKSIKEAVILLNKTNLFLNDKLSEQEYKKFLQDKSYLTGLSWKIKTEIKHLEF